MNLLVIDTIHGGKEIGSALTQNGHHVEMVDVYRNVKATDEIIGKKIRYDRVIVPVHLDPDNSVLQKISGIPQISHHEAVKWILGGLVPKPFVEITGAQGKTTTAHALSFIIPGQGILHTSNGTFRMPEKELLFRRSITPASIIPAAAEARAIGGWLIAEESLGVTCAGDLAIITSPLDYRCAGGKKSAFEIKINSVKNARKLLVASGVRSEIPGVIHADEIVSVPGDSCNYELNGISGSFYNPLLELSGYRIPLMTAAAAGCIMGIDPSPLSRFEAIPGRYSTTTINNRLIVDNSNSGTNEATTIEAARYARKISGKPDLVLVIGQEAHAVCEGFPIDEIIHAISLIIPDWVVLVGQEYHEEQMSGLSGIIPVSYAADLAWGKELAISSGGTETIVLAVKSWR
jgi:coenzyme F430 synthetase